MQPSITQHLLRATKYWLACDRYICAQCGLEWLKAFSGAVHWEVTGCGQSSTLCLHKHIYKPKPVLKFTLD